MKINIEPTGFPCHLEDLEEPGLFLYGDTLCLLTDYGDRYLCSGDALGSHIIKRNPKVQPVTWRIYNDN